MTAAEIIDRLGGQARVAELCEVTVQAVHQWKKKDHVPKAQLKFLQAARPEAFDLPNPRPLAPSQGPSPNSVAIADAASGAVSTSAATPSDAADQPTSEASHG